MIDMSTKLQGEGRHRWQRKAANPKGTVKPLPPQSRVLKAQRRASFLTTKYRIAIAELGGERMAEKRKIDDISDLTVSAKVMGECLSVGDRMVRHLADEGLLKRDSHGKYLLLHSVKNYILALKASKAGEHVDVGPGNVLDLNQEKASNEHWKALINEIKLQLIQGKVHKSEDVGRVLTNMLLQFKNKIIAIPAKMAVKLEGKSKQEIQEIVTEELSAALDELSEYSPSDYYSSEHIDIDENVFLERDIFEE